MNQNHPPRISAMIDKMNLINGDLSSFTMSISLDGSIGVLPETQAKKQIIRKENSTKFFEAVKDTFSQNDLVSFNSENFR